MGFTMGELLTQKLLPSSKSPLLRHAFRPSAYKVKQEDNVYRIEDKINNKYSRASKLLNVKNWKSDFDKKMWYFACTINRANLDVEYSYMQKISYLYSLKNLQNNTFLILTM